MAKKNSNNFNEISPILMAAIFIIFIVAMIFVTFFGMNLQSPVSKYFPTNNIKVNNNLRELLEKQREMDDKIIELSKNGGYTFESPLIFKAPYELNKLCAVIIFNTDEETSVKVNINDVDITTVKKSKEHIIPIYYLYADATNLVKLTLDDGSTKTYTIMVEAYNNTIDGFETKDIIGDYPVYFIGGNIDVQDSTLRGFDKNNNLISYYSYDHISGYALFKDSIALGYKQNMGVKNDLRLNIDYLGRISSITDNTSEINYESNIFGVDIDYIGAPYNFYEKEIDNYSFTEYNNSDSYSAKNILILDEYTHLLKNAVKYDGEFNISYMDEYIAYTGDLTGELLIIDSKGKLYSYPIDKSGIIKTDIKGKKSLYLNKDGIIYTLKTTLNE